MLVFPNAKINLGLHVLQRRTDGFHNIQSIFYPVGWSDVLESVVDESKSGQCQFSSTGLPIPGNPESNLCRKAYQILATENELAAVKIHLQKIIPIGAGLGGGSADGAFALSLLNQLLKLGHSDAHLEVLAAQLGSDCPFFIQNKPSLVSGRGEVLEPISIDLSSYYIVLVNPGIHIGTAEAYAGIQPDPDAPDLRKWLDEPLENWKGNVTNHFEHSVFPNHPKLPAIKEKLYEIGAVYASMTGSGSTLYGLFEKPTHLREHFPDCSIWEGKMG